MDTTVTKILAGLHLAQIAWVVKDITIAESFFKATMGMANFGKAQIIRAATFEGTYYGEPSNGENLTAQGYSGGTFIELIQPVAGNSVFRDYLEKNPAGGVQHVAYRIPIVDFDKVISQFEDNGFPVISTFDTPIAKIVFFDTSKEIGVMTEIMGITKEGEAAVEQMKNQTD